MYWYEGEASATEARTRIVAWSTGFVTADTTRSALAVAVDLAGAHQLGIWDSIIIAGRRREWV